MPFFLFVFPPPCVFVGCLFYDLARKVLDLHTEQCPVTTKNFLKVRDMYSVSSDIVLNVICVSSAACTPNQLAKTKYYNNCVFFSVEKDFVVRTGDPTNTGKGGGRY